MMNLILNKLKQKKRQENRTTLQSMVGKGCQEKKAEHSHATHTFSRDFIRECEGGVG